MPQPSHPIGIFDSGVGGLSVLREIRALLPHENLIYLGDQAHAPYGPRGKEELQRLTVAIIQFLLKKEIKLLVIACNTASAAALKAMRLRFPDLPIVGMEPAVKPAAHQTQSGKVGVLATPSTFAGELYASVVERFASGVEVFESSCPGLVSQIEKGELDAPLTRQILSDAIEPMLAKGADTLVLGCTHYPFVLEQIQAITGPELTIIDPAPAVARQAGRVLEAQGLLNKSRKKGSVEYLSTGDPQVFNTVAGKLLGQALEASALKWQGKELKAEHSLSFEDIKAGFEMRANPQNAVPMKAYMRNQFEYYGLTSPEMRAFLRAPLEEAKGHTQVDWELVKALWEAPQREMQYFAIAYLNAVKKLLISSDLPILKTLIQEKSWWDTVDSLDGLVGFLVQKDPALKEEMRSWSKDPDFWVRRSAIDHQLGFKAKTDTSLLEEIILNNLGSKEFFINKAIGWSLRDYACTAPDWVKAFLLKHKAELAPLSFREAAKHLQFD